MPLERRPLASVVSELRLLSNVVLMFSAVGETICGGSGAGPSWHGTSGVHVSQRIISTERC